MLTIDGSQGEGGGQILRSALALSMVTGTPFAMERIRAGRKKPGLMRQHLTAVRAAARIGRATVDGAAIGSQALKFQPGRIAAGTYRFDVGTAGSTTLVLQTVLPALLTASGPSRLTLEGGTHNPAAPTFDFLQRAFLPMVSRMGVEIEATLDRPGFYPGGGGCFCVEVHPAPSLRRVDLLDRGAVRRMSATATVAHLPRHVAERELDVLRERLGLAASCLAVKEASHVRGPGNVVLLEIESEHVTEVFTGFGRRGVRAEAVAEGVVNEASVYLEAGVPVGTHLADQLLLPMVLAGGGSFRTLPLSRHSATNIEIIRSFLDVEITVQPQGERVTQVSVGGSRSAAS